MTPRLKPLNQQTIVITGASSGIGLTAALHAAGEGANVVLISRNEEALRRICDDIRARGGCADYVIADVGRREEVRRAVQTIIERHGGFDTWVNDAGVGIYATLEETSDEDHERLFQTNYWGVVFGSLEAVKHLKMRGGALINLGSIASDMATPMLSAYSASKHAVKGFTDALRMELLHEGAPVSVTLIKPSGIQTPFGDHAKNYMEVASQVPPPVYSPALVADAILEAAERPIRNITIGGAGRLMTLFARFAPHLTDRLYGYAFYRTARDPSRPKKPSSALYEPGSDGRTFGEQSTPVRRTSLYTAMRLHPVLAMVAGAAAGIAAAGALGLLTRRNPLDADFEKRRPAIAARTQRRVPAA